MDDSDNCGCLVKPKLSKIDRLSDAELKKEQSKQPQVMNEF